MQREVETINLSYFCYSPIKLPVAIFTCSSLVVLKLMNVTVDRTSTVNLPLLKTLHMDRVGFATKGEYLEMILSGCPNIHHLHIKGLDLQRSFIPLAVTFTNLIHMELFVSQFNWFWIVGLLNSFPFLQVLDIGGEKSARPLGIPDQPFPQPVPECISSHLRICTIRNFDGVDHSVGEPTRMLSFHGEPLPLDYHLPSNFVGKDFFVV
ncbi:hypothetical protein PIB30_032763 [Stylosanthes scabra]|uniref:Uncharacterized protein n=1 Tax=Stylosanthes scabra TaxID=79078 RepID=A0ABU6UBP5_9FABA|nr:hypothetical protein [Stylosanthes scabra]